MKTLLLPNIYEDVTVFCEDFSCLGHLNSVGQWIASFTNEKLKGVIGWQPIQDIDETIPKNVPIAAAAGS